MWNKLLSYSTIAIGFYILFVTIYNLIIPKNPQSQIQYHLGCYSEDNDLNYAGKITQFISNVQSKSQIYQLQRKSFTLTKRVNFNEISKQVSKDFQRFLNQYYQIKSKSAYQQNYQNSIRVAQKRYQTCKQQIKKKFNEEQCQNTWQIYKDSKQQYQNLKKILKQKIQIKQQLQRKISYLILDTNYQDVQEYQLNLTNQINVLGQKLELINNKKIQFLNKRVSFQDLLAADKLKLSSSQSMLNQCQKNMKIINFCNQLNQELKSIKITFTKHDLQKKIQRKQMIIDTHLNAIRNAQKLQDYLLLEFNRQNLAQNQQELKLLQLSLQDFKTFEQSYCSQCSSQKINQLRIQVQRLNNNVKNYQIEIELIVEQQKILAHDISIATNNINRLQEEKDFNINSKICLTQECQQKRSHDLLQYGSTLNQMKKNVLDHKFELQQHIILHKNKINDIQKWIFTVNQVINCINEKKYYQNLSENRPRHNQDQLQKIQKLKQKLIKQLERFSHF